MLNRRDLLISASAAAVAAVLPKVALAEEPPKIGLELTGYMLIDCLCYVFLGLVKTSDIQRIFVQRHEIELERLDDPRERERLQDGLDYAWRIRARHESEGPCVAYTYEQAMALVEELLRDGKLVDWREKKYPMPLHVYAWSRPIGGGWHVPVRIEPVREEYRTDMLQPFQVA